MFLRKLFQIVFIAYLKKKEIKKEKRTREKSYFGFNNIRLVIFYILPKIRNYLPMIITRSLYLMDD